MVLFQRVLLSLFEAINDISVLIPFVIVINKLTSLAIKPQRSDMIGYMVLGILLRFCDHPLGQSDSMFDFQDKEHEKGHQVDQYLSKILHLKGKKESVLIVALGVLLY